MFLVVLLVASVAGDLEPTTTRTYDLEVPGSKPIRIIEGEPLWHNKKPEESERAFSADSTDDPLRQFLSNYADALRRNQNKNKEEEKEEQRLENVHLIQPETDDKGKSWDMLQYQKHHHPYEDKKGWVSMEPVPWSVSKISKWQSKYKPSNPKPWDDYEAEEQTQSRPWNKPTPNYDTYFDRKPSEPKPPVYPKPSAVYGQKVHVNYGTKYQHKHDENCNHSKRPLYDNGDIITDGLPANFPQPYEGNRRQGTDFHPDTHPFSGDGEWVLLSTTKGYKFPRNRQRALQINPDSIGAHRGVHLTVLPPLKNSKVNMTTSHGGLLQVESTFETVEQARKQHIKKQKLKKKPQAKPTIKPIRQVLPTITTRKNTAPDSSAVLAAVGAGMIPATMAMLVPMALGGRRKREIPDSSTAKYLELTLPRNL